MEALGTTTAELANRYSGKSSQPEKTLASTPASRTDRVRHWPETVVHGNWRGFEASVAVQCLEAVDAARWPLLLAGCPGSGKSVAACLLARQSPSWRFWEASRLLALIVSARTSDSKTAPWPVWPELCETPGQTVELTESQMLRHIETAGMLVLDDVGTRDLRDAQADVFLTILNLRVNKPTIITTNCDRAKLTAAVGARSVSRILAGSVVKFPQVDRRQA